MSQELLDYEHLVRELKAALDALEEKNESPQNTTLDEFLQYCHIYLCKPLSVVCRD
jgi:hypothetical protein